MEASSKIIEEGLKVKKMSQLIGLDHGEKNIGVALSDMDQKIAIGLEKIICEEGNVFKRLSRIIIENNCKKVVIGLPLGLSGQETERTYVVRSFGQEISKMLGIEIDFWDERLSSDEAIHILRSEGKKKEEINKIKDIVSAKLILQGYLDDMNLRKK